MKITFYTVTSLFVIFAIYFIYGCSSNSVTQEQSNTKTSVGIFLGNDTLAIATDIENTTYDFKIDTLSKFTTDSVDVYTEFSDITAGKGTFLLLGNSGINRDTLCKKVIDRASLPVTERYRSDRFGNSFSFVLSGFTGKATIKVSGKR